MLISQRQRDWDKHLPLELFAYRTAVQESTLMFGRELCMLVDYIFGVPPEPKLPLKPGMKYFMWLRERLFAEGHSCRGRTETALSIHSVHAWGQNFALGELVWVYCPTRKKGLSPKLMAHCVGQLPYVVYLVQLARCLQVVLLHCDSLAPYQPRLKTKKGSG